MLICPSGYGLIATPKPAMVLEEKIGRCGHRSAALSIIIDYRLLKVPDLQAKRFIIKDSTDAPNLSQSRGCIRGTLTADDTYGTILGPLWHFPWIAILPWTWSDICI